MTRAIFPILGLASILLSGCNVPGRKATQPAAPPAPVASAPKAPPPPEPSFSIPQTQVKLPKEQPISEEALASIPETPYPGANVPSQPTRQTARRPPANQSRREPPETQAAPEQAKVQAPAAPADDAMVIQSIVPANERAKLEGEIQGTLNRARDLMREITARGLTSQNQNAVASVQSFIKLSERALQRGDTVQARNLADRALVVAGDLQRGR